MWPSIGKPGTTRHPSNFFFLHLRSCRRPDIELSKFYRRSLSHSRYNWRASVASETLTGVTQSKIGDVCLFIYLYICLDVCMSFCTLTLRIFVFAPRSTSSQSSLNRILRSSDHYPYRLRNWIVYGFELFCGCS